MISKYISSFLLLQLSILVRICFYSLIIESSSSAKLYYHRKIKVTLSTNYLNYDNTNCIQKNRLSVKKQYCTQHDTHENDLSTSTSPSSVISVQLEDKEAVTYGIDELMKVVESDMLPKLFGHQKFRAGQSEVISKVLSGQFI